MPTFGQPTVTQIIRTVADNTCGATLDLTNNGTFKSKSTESMQSLSEALKRNTTITTLTLKQLEITDAGAEALAGALEVNQTIAALDLSENSLSAPGVIAISHGLISNTGVTTLNLMQQKVKSFGGEVVERYAAVLETNLTLTKIVWRADSKNDHLNKRLTRNGEIDRLKKAGQDYQHVIAKYSRTGAGGVEGAGAAGEPEADAGRQRAAEAAERQRVEEAAERKRVEEEAEVQRVQALDAERKRLEEAEAQAAGEAERKRLHEEAEQKKAEEEAEVARLAEVEAERIRLEEEAAKKAADEENGNQ